MLTRFEGVECYNYSPLIYCYNCHNVAIVGSGTLDGSGQDGFAQWKDKQKTDQDLIRHLGNDTQPSTALGRVFGAGHYLRPSFVQFYACSSVLIEGIRLIDSPFWVVHPVNSRNVIVRGITVDSPHINNDGIDPEGSSLVLIENNNVTSGDDCISIKSGRDADAWRVGSPSEDIIIRNLTCSTTANAICAGSEMSGGVRRVLVDGGVEVMKAENLIEFKANLDRGAFISDIFMRGLTAEEVGSCIGFTNNSHGARGGNFPTLFSNITVANTRCRSTSKAAISIEGLATRPIANVTLSDFTVDKADEATKITNTVGLKFESVTVNGKPVQPPKVTHTPKLQP